MLNRRSWAGEATFISALTQQPCCCLVLMLRCTGLIIVCSCADLTLCWGPLPRPWRAVKRTLNSGAVECRSSCTKLEFGPKRMPWMWMINVSEQKLGHLVHMLFLDCSYVTCPNSSKCSLGTDRSRSHVVPLGVLHTQSYTVVSPASYSPPSFSISNHSKSLFQTASS